MGIAISGRYGELRRALEAFALQALTLQLAGAADGLCSLAGTAFGRLLEMAAQLHLAEDALALHLLLERLERLIDIVVTNENLHLAAYSLSLRPVSPGRAYSHTIRRVDRRGAAYIIGARWTPSAKSALPHAPRHAIYM